MQFWDRVRDQIKSENTTQEWVSEKTGISIHTLKGWMTRDVEPRVSEAALIAEALRISLDELLGKEFMKPSANGSWIVSESPQAAYTVASLVPQKVSAGFGQQLLDYAPEDLAQRAPYPKKWGNGLLAIEVMGDSMTGVQIFDGDLVYFKPGELRGDGIYVLQINGDVLVKRVSFDSLNRKLVISSENPRYPQQVEPQDSQAVTILGKVKGWLHEHVY